MNIILLLGSIGDWIVRIVDMVIDWLIVNLDIERL